MNRYLQPLSILNLNCHLIDHRSCKGDCDLSKYCLPALMPFHSFVHILVCTEKVLWFNTLLYHEKMCDWSLLLSFTGQTNTDV